MELRDSRDWLMDGHELPFLAGVATALFVSLCLWGLVIAAWMIVAG